LAGRASPGGFPFARLAWRWFRQSGRGGKRPRQRNEPRRDVAGAPNSAGRPVSRILSCAVIPLGAALPRTLISDLPGGFGTCLEQPDGAGPAPSVDLAPGPRFPPYLVLLRVGFTMPPPLLPERCALTAPFHPYRCAGRPRDESSDLFRASARRQSLPKEDLQRRYLLCGTGRPRALTPASRTLSGTLPCGVRTFLPRGWSQSPPRQRPPGPPASRYCSANGNGQWHPFGGAMPRARAAPVGRCRPAGADAGDVPALLHFFFELGVSVFARSLAAGDPGGTPRVVSISR
jgi:hypothetical protein